MNPAFIMALQLVAPVMLWKQPFMDVSVNQVTELITVKNSPGTKGITWQILGVTRRVVWSEWGAGDEREGVWVNFWNQFLCWSLSFLELWLKSLRGLRMVINVSLQPRGRASDFEGRGSNTFLFLPATVILSSCACCFESHFYGMRCMPVYLTNSSQTCRFFHMWSHPEVRHGSYTAAALPCGGRFGVLRELRFPLLQLFPVPCYWDSEQLCLA